MGSLDVKIESILPKTLQHLSHGQVKNNKLTISPSSVSDFGVDKATGKSLVSCCRNRAAPLGIQVDIGLTGGQGGNPWKFIQINLDTWGRKSGFILPASFIVCSPPPPNTQ